MEIDFNMAAFASAVRQKRGEQPLLHAAEDVGVSHATLSRIENLRNTPDVKTFGRICAWLGVPMETFYINNDVEYVE